jgi:hypothetical protein
MLTAGASGYIIDRANAADINVYAVDAAAPRPPAMVGATAFLMTLSDNTGGRAIVGPVIPEDHVPEIFDENKSYYLLGYESHNLKTRESLKRIEVKVNRPDLTVRTQTVYDAPAPPGSAKRKPDLPPETKAIEDIVPKADVPLKATAAAFADTTGKGAMAAIVLNVGAPAKVTAATDTIDVVVRAFTPDGRPQGDAHQVTSVNLTSADGKSPARAEVFSRLALKPGRFSLRIAAHSRAAATEGSVYTDVVVPDFAKEPVSLSGLVLSATPGLRAAPREILTAFLPILPTAERTFDRTQQVTAFIRVYQGGEIPPQAALIGLRVVDDHDLVVLDLTSTAPTAAFAMSRSADYRYTLPLRDWHPGAYLLTVSATVGSHVATREVRIDIR